ncbi:MAG: hypothetical protein PUK24_01290 [Elusimicrobia bacterium]|nr:hypothetical protein [Elusimicrobiota bacterium]MDY6039337.1 hypothetical protein [Elusimicrobiaceae bacterium]
MKKLSIFIICALCALGTNLFAQGKQLVKVPKVAEAATKAARQSAAVTVKVPAVPKVPSIQTPPVPTSPRVAAFVNQHPRTLVSLQKMVGLSTRQAWTNLQRLGAVYTPKNPHPQLQEENSFTTADLTEFAAPNIPEQTLPEFPFQNQRGLIYRGMALDTKGKAIRNILENGLRTQDVGRESNTLLYSLAGTNTRSAALRQPLINLTDSGNDAVMWANRLRKNEILVVTVVKSSRTGSVITSSKDIPATDIYAQTALLKINGKLTWCKLELEGNDLRVTPYQEIPSAE